MFLLSLLKVLDDKASRSAAESMEKTREKGAFVGHHNTKGIAVFIDEASGTPDVINNSILGFFTELNPNRFWIMTSNPRRLSGWFYDIFNKPFEDWKRYQIDTRTVEGIDPSLNEGIISRYGIDSDEARIEVLGQFPQQEVNSFIPHNYILEAMDREAVRDEYAPLIMGCDIAGEGGDKTVVLFRRGNIIEDIFNWSGLLIQETNQKIAKLIAKYNPDAIVVDANGIGAVTANYLECFKYFQVEKILGQRSSTEPERYRNLRTELYDTMKQAIIDVLQLPKDCPDLINELKSIVAFEEVTTGRLAIESKRKGGSKYGVRSPDFVDALAYTYAVTPARKDGNYRYNSSYRYEAEELLVDKRFAGMDNSYV